MPREKRAVAEKTYTEVDENDVVKKERRGTKKVKADEEGHAMGDAKPQIANGGDHINEDVAMKGRIVAKKAKPDKKGSGVEVHLNGDVVKKGGRALKSTESDQEEATNAIAKPDSIADELTGAVVKKGRQATKKTESYSTVSDENAEDLTKKGRQAVKKTKPDDTVQESAANLSGDADKKGYRTVNKVIGTLDPVLEETASDSGEEGVKKRRQVTKNAKPTETSTVDKKLDRVASDLDGVVVKKERQATKKVKAAMDVDQKSAGDDNESVVKKGRQATKKVKPDEEVAMDTAEELNGDVVQNGRGAANKVKPDKSVVNGEIVKKERKTTKNKAAVIDGAELVITKSPKKTKEKKETVVAVNHNEDICVMFKDLGHLHRQLGEIMQANSYSKVARILKEMDHRVADGKEAKSFKGIGEASAGKLDEFLSTGEVAKMAELREKLGQNVPT